MTDFKKLWMPRILIGALAGVLAYLLLSFLTQPGALFGVPLSWDFTFCFDGRVPETLGLCLGLLLWAAFGAEVGVATIPFADTGRTLAARSALHFAVTAVTASAWCALNFGWAEVQLCLLLLSVGYALIWLTRWVGWFSELADIREKLGLVSTPSALKGREVLPYLLLLGMIYGLAMPILSIFDGPVPFFTGMLLPYVVYPILAGAVGFHSGKRCGFTVLVPAAVYLLSLLNDFWLWLAKILGIANMSYGYVTLGLVYAAAALGFHVLGALMRARSGRAL